MKTSILSILLTRGYSSNVKFEMPNEEQGVSSDWKRLMGYILLIFFQASSILGNDKRTENYSTNNISAENTQQKSCQLPTRQRVPSGNKKLCKNAISPLFFFATVPSLLIEIDGTPIFKDVNAQLQKIINSNFLILSSKKSNKYYLRAAYRWFETSMRNESNILNLSWTKTSDLPENIKSYAKSNIKVITNIDKLKAIPKIFISCKPAELIQTTGPPEFRSIPRTELSYLQNSDTDIFRYKKNKRLYLLVSGRWFTAEQLKGPWLHILSQKLPEDFMSIPFNSRKWYVLACIAGTQAAQEAIKMTEKPQMKKVKRTPLKLNILFNGSPVFLPLKNTKIEYAVNTSDSVIKFSNKYYTCKDATWYESNSLKGTWEVSIEIPAEIYSIPPTSFLYYTTFVKVYAFDKNNVEVGYTGGYRHSFIENGSIVYGSGYQYKSVWDKNWYPRPKTYAYNIGYDPFNHKWLRCNRYSTSEKQHVQWQHESSKQAETLPPIVGGNYLIPSAFNERSTVKQEIAPLTQPLTSETEDDDTISKNDLINDDIKTRQDGDWDSSVTEASLEPPNRKSTEIIHSVASKRIKRREIQSTNRKTNNNANSRQRGVSKFERYRTYNSKSLKQSYGGGRSRTGTFNSRGQYGGIFKK